VQVVDRLDLRTGRTALRAVLHDPVVLGRGAHELSSFPQVVRARLLDVHILPAWQAQIAISACQWFGVAIEIASILGSSSSRRTSMNVRGLLLTSPRRLSSSVSSTSHKAATSTFGTRANASR
jgi:hypothetical protein